MGRWGRGSRAGQGLASGGRCVKAECCLLGDGVGWSATGQGLPGAMGQRAAANLRHEAAPALALRESPTFRSSSNVTLRLHHTPRHGPAPDDPPSSPCTNAPPTAIRRLSLPSYRITSSPPQAAGELLAAEAPSLDAPSAAAAVAAFATFNGRNGPFYTLLLRRLLEAEEEAAAGWMAAAAEREGRRPGRGQGDEEGDEGLGAGDGMLTPQVAGALYRWVITGWAHGARAHDPSCEAAASPRGRSVAHALSHHLRPLVRNLPCGDLLPPHSHPPAPQGLRAD